MSIASTDHTKKEERKSSDVSKDNNLRMNLVVKSESECQDSPKIFISEHSEISVASTEQNSCNSRRKNTVKDSSISPTRTYETIKKVVSKSSLENSDVSMEANETDPSLNLEVKSESEGQDSPKIFVSEHSEMSVASTEQNCCNSRRKNTVKGSSISPTKKYKRTKRTVGKNGLEDSDVSKEANEADITMALVEKRESKGQKTPKIFKCDLCCKEFKYKVSLKRHSMRHTGEQYVCRICKKGFNQKYSLQKHYKRIHVGEKPNSHQNTLDTNIENVYPLSSDKGEIISYDVLIKGKGEDPIGTLDPECSKKFTCNVCSKVFKYKVSLKRHATKHTGEKKYACDFCQKCFFVKGDMQRHRLIHIGEKPYECDICGKGFVQKSNMEKHRRFHFGEKPYSCDVCGRFFSDIRNRNRHTKIHKNEKSCFCDLCGKGFTQMSNMQRHREIHIGEKLYMCEICGKGFTQKPNLDRHVEIHMGEKSYECDICRKPFTQKGNMLRHRNRHNGKMHYSCDICESSFSKKCDLEIHQMVHKGETPYECLVCGKGFKKKIYMKSHEHRCHSSALKTEIIS